MPKFDKFDNKIKLINRRSRKRFTLNINQRFDKTYKEMDENTITDLLEFKEPF